MLGSRTSWILQAWRSEIRTSGEATPNFPSAPCHKIHQNMLAIFWGILSHSVIAGNTERFCFRCTHMKKILDYIKSVRGEWFKIVWPSRDTVIRATIMILIFSGLAALFFFVVDSGLNALMGWIF